MLWVLLLLLAGGGVGSVPQCPLLQTTDPGTPCHVRLSSVSGGGPAPPFFYKHNLPLPSRFHPCPLRQTLDRSVDCYKTPVGEGDSPFYLTIPLPEGADSIDETVYPTKPPSELTFPNPVFDKS